MAGIRTADESRPLNAEEKRVLDDLLKRETRTATPGTRTGKPYIALTNLSLPRRSGDGSQNDLVRAGEKVYLTDEEAAQFMRHGMGDGRQMSSIVPAGEEQAKVAGRIPPRAYSGALRQPPQPPPGSDLPRPDPAGSSTVQEMRPPAPVPEAAEPMPGSEATAGQEGFGAPPVNVDAEDIIPDRVRARQARKAE